MKISFLLSHLAQRLSVVSATTEDAGHYKCEARNEYNVVGPSEYVSVEGN